MAILREFHCATHGDFESRFSQCPQGCVEGVERVFRTPPMVVSQRTRNIDTTLKQIAKDRKLTDLRNHKGSLAASMPPPPPPAVPLELNNPIAGFVQRNAARFGGAWETDPTTGAIWRNNNQVDPNSRARPDGKPMDSIMGMENKVPVVTTVDKACDGDGRVIPPPVKRFESNTPMTSKNAVASK